MGFQHKSRIRSYQFLSGNQEWFAPNSLAQTTVKKLRISELRRKLTPHSEVTVEKEYLGRIYFVLFDPF